MPSSNDYLIYVLDLIKEVDDVHYKKMMGEYILYSGQIIFGGIYDNRFLIKKTEYSSLLKLKEVVPYPNAKPMLLMDSEDSDVVKEIVDSVIKDIIKNG